MATKSIKMMVSYLALVCIMLQVTGTPTTTNPSTSEEKLVSDTPGISATPIPPEQSKEANLQTPDVSTILSPIPVEKLTPTDPLEITKIVFQPLQSNFGNVGPLLYDLLTDEDALGKPMSKLSKLIAKKIGVHNLTDDMKLIFDNALNEEIQKRALGIYEKIKDIGIPNTTGETIEDVVEILGNIFTNQETVENIREIIKSSKI